MLAVIITADPFGNPTAIVHLILVATAPHPSWSAAPSNLPADAQTMSIYHEGARFGEHRAGLFVDAGVGGNPSGRA
eukprot:4300663-Lingulodinium_polyedra.AAC.1